MVKLWWFNGGGRYSATVNGEEIELGRNVEYKTDWRGRTDCNKIAREEIALILACRGTFDIRLSYEVINPNTNNRKYLVLVLLVLKII